MFVSGFECDTDGCHEHVYYGGDAPSAKDRKYGKMYNRDRLMRYGRKRGWSFGTKILCPACRKLYGKPMTKSQVKRYYPSGSHWIDLTDIMTRKEFMDKIIREPASVALNAFMVHNGFDYGDIYEPDKQEDMLRDQEWKYAIRL